MPGAYLFGWDDEHKKWVKVLANSEGKLIIDPSEIFEEDPTDGEVGKAPTSNWAHDHEADASAHHGRYTDEEARSAIGNVLDSLGRLTKSLNFQYHDIDRLRFLNLRWDPEGNKLVRMWQHGDTNEFAVGAYEFGIGYIACKFSVYDGSAYRPVATQVVVDDKISDHASDAQAHHAHIIDYKEPDAYDYEPGISMFGITEESGWPTTYATIVTHWVNEWRNIQWCVRVDVGKIYVRVYNPTVGWQVWHPLLTDAHADDSSAHHARYTDEEARAACGVDGDLYWSAPGVGFSPSRPDINPVEKELTGTIIALGDGIHFSAPVTLPHGATVKGAVVTGNVSAQEETWELWRINLGGGSSVLMASGNIGSEDATINNAVIDNENYLYYLLTSSLDTGDTIAGARITYTV